MADRNLPRPAAVNGIDIGKNLFHVVGLSCDGTPVQKVRFRRDTLLQFFARAQPSIVGMESCAGSQWLARKIQALGHKVRLIRAQFVTPYVKSNKNDIIDAEAIAEAARRPTMRFVAVKEEDQVDLQALHRIRDQMVGSRTRLINQMRAFCLEYGVPLRQGAGIFKLELPRALNDEGNDLWPVMRRLVGALFADLRRLEERIREVTQEIEAVADREDVTRRLMTIPGIGALGATAVLAAIGDGLQFRKARDLAAWLGLVPRQYSTGGKETLFGVSKRGNRYLRKLLVHGARSCFRHLDRTRDRLGSWLDGLQARMHLNKAVVVALAAKMARIVWVVLNKPGALYERRDPAFA
ncbi:IS110 family transposase (plasmid) [Bradyrhizobium sp. 62B]|uniref:IS110 family transposase n=1 Tax=Bradyrhizobium sp. 62B TaxID=2898442 RepID=UPI002557E333|nr:IS110 family transposase [Bradyrhizobium sp. 62B]